MFQFRVPGAPPTAYYSPGRDLAHVGMLFVQDGLDYLQHLRNKKDPRIVEYMKDNRITDEELDRALQDFLQAVEEEFKNPNEKMLPTNSFANHRPCVRYLILGCIGAIFVAASIQGRKDVVTREDAVELKGEEFHAKITGLKLKFQEPQSKNKWLTRLMELLNIDLWLRWPTFL